MSPLLFLHGFAGHPDDWNEVVARLPPGTVRSAEALYGHRGHAEVEERVERFDDEVDRLVRRLGLPVHVVGYSLGGRLALGLLTRHPHAIARATLIGCQPGLRTEAERAARLRTDAAWIDLLEREGVGRFADAWEAQPLFSSQSSLPAEVVAPPRARRRRHHPLGLAKALRACGLGAMPDLWPGLRECRVPITLVHGELDEKFAGIAAEMAAAVPSATVISVPGAGHNPVLERPRAVASLLAP
ncbi:MAG: alpha/beta fold hydrolase [Myxococcales bacterium]